jgi:glycosyltransferase involved in cell wall biosynthesis
VRVVFIALHFAEYSAHLGAALAENNDVLLFLYGENTRNELGDRLLNDFNCSRLHVLTLEKPKGLSGIIRNTKEITLAVRRFRPDVVHIQEGLRDELVLSLPLLIRYPLLMTIHDPVSHSGHDAKAMRFSRYRFYRQLLRRSVDRVFAHGVAMVNEVGIHLPRLKARIHSVPHGPLGSSGELSLASPPPLCSFLFFGRIHEYKGLRYFVEAIQRLHREGISVRGVIAGRGSDLKPNLGLIEQTPAAFEIIERYVSEDEVRRLFAVLPYVDGTQSGVAAMALGYGRPVIATRVGAIPECVRDGVNGILVAPRNAEELADAMRRLMNDREYWLTLAQGALTLRSGELSWRQIAATTERAYRAALLD